MIFQFFTTAKNGEELQKSISETVEIFFPSDKWSHGIIEVCQTEQSVEVAEENGKKKKKKGKMQAVFQVSIEVYPKGLSNSLIKIGYVM
jgi:hypothetical protein